MSLIGNRNTLAFELTPVAPTWELRYAPERAVWAGLAGSYQRLIPHGELPISESIKSQHAKSQSRRTPGQPFAGNPTSPRLSSGSF